MKVALIGLALCLSAGLLHAANPADLPGATAIDEQPRTARGNNASQDDVATKQESAQREVEASEDPMSKQEATTLKTPEPSYTRENVFDVYGSIRLRLRNLDNSIELTDGGSRIGVDAEYPLHARFNIFGRAEVGFNLLSELDLLDAKDRPPEGKDGSSLFTRLLYVGLEAPGYFLVYGKNWSAYYKVADFTDRFAGTGGDAAGAFNAGTDGGATGTGRAQGVLQTRLHLGKISEVLEIKPFSLNLQVQRNEPIPLVDGAHYGTAIGLSTIYQLQPNFDVGIAYNIARINDLDDPDVRNAGLDGDAQAFLVGARQFGEKWYLGTVVSRLQNQDTTDQDKYFDGWGWEVYGQYQLGGKIWLTGGWNYLHPDSDTLNGDYEIKYGVVGLRYSQDGFRNMIYTNIKLEQSRLTDGERLDNVYTIGVRWNLEDAADWMVRKYRSMSGH